jgi:diguanylate cyclase (GGDEF)-like protein
LLSEMNVVREQSRLAGEASAQQDAALARARLTYTDRAATRVQEILSDINQDMVSAKEGALISESWQARRTRLILLPLSVVGALLLLPALLYARHQNRNILAYEAELEDERNLLERRVTTRTSELRTEMEHRKRMQDFNDDRNRLLEQVAEGKNLHEILGRLAQSAEQSVPKSQCIILLSGEPTAKVICPSVSLDIAVYLETILLRSWDSVSIADPRAQIAVFLSDQDPSTKIRFSDVWSQGYRGILAVPITDPQQPLHGVIALLLWESGELDSLAREVLLSASRMASVALKNNRMQDELFRRAHQDALTNLPNRALFQDRLQQALARAGRSHGNVGMLCIDLDGFKEINDRYGHETGDRLLQEVAQRLTSFIRKSDTVARIGGDEFVASIGDVRERQDLANLCQTLVRLLGAPYSFEGVSLRITASVGAAMFPEDGGSVEDLSRQADMAMYRAKELGRNTFHMFSADLGEKLARRRQMEQYLQEALQGEGFQLHYQPICTISRAVIGLEALLRFASPELSSISPAEFILVAEQTGQVSAIGEWVLREACRQGKQWQEEGFSPLPIAVNVSPIQLGRQDFAERVKQILSETGLAPEWLHIEVTETAVMSNFEEGRLQLHALANLGIQISIDDFGTGHSSLSYLHCLPIKALKIDRSFVQRMVDSQESKAIVRAIVAMAQSLELDVIAEGVETEEQLRAVAAAGCGKAQGYLFSKPLDPSAVTALLRHATVPILDATCSTNKT